MRNLLYPSHITDQGQIHQLHLFWTIEALVAISFTVESIIEIILMPADITRWIMVIGVIDSLALILFTISRAGYIRQASLAFVITLWILVTGLAITENGVRAPTVDIAYLVIILVAGLVINEQAGIITGIVCGLTLLGLSIAGIRGLLPPNQVHRTILTTWEADIFYLAIVVGLQYLAIHTIKEALNQAHHELMERRRVEANLLKSEEERARNQMQIELHHLLSEQVEQERLKIARDLHDGPVQDLIGAAFSIQGLIEDAPSERMKQDLQEVQTSLQEQVSSLRAFAGELRSPTLVRFGLSKAIDEHLEQFREKHTEINVQLEIPPKEEGMPEAYRITIFRIYQEVMNNIAKHARATQVFIKLDISKEHVKLEVKDNGVGFNPPIEWIDLARHGHLGLVGMRERAENVGGQFSIITQKEQGTTVRVTIPMNGPRNGNGVMHAD